MENGVVLRRLLGFSAAAVGGLILVLGWVVFEPIIAASGVKLESTARIQMPEMDLSRWHELPVQEGGRIKPFESACEEAVRNITGRARFEGHDPVDIVLMWRLLAGTSNDESLGDWEKYAFILCPDRDLRELIYRSLAEKDENLTDEQLHGKYVSPENLRKSPVFRKLLLEAEEIERADRERGSKQLSPVQRKAEEVAGRLVLFDSISQNRPPEWGAPRPKQEHSDPLHVIVLDRVAGGGWFSLGDLRKARSEYQDLQWRKAATVWSGGLVSCPAIRVAAGLLVAPQPEHWSELMRDRLARAPQLYINPERQKTLSAFEEMIKSGSGDQAIGNLETLLTSRYQARIEEFQKENPGGQIALEVLVRSPIVAGLDGSERESIGEWLRKAGEKGSYPVGGIAQQMRSIFKQRTEAVAANLRMRLPAVPAQYQPDDPRYRMLHLDYLENYYPDLYPDSAAWQQYPVTDVERVLNAFAVVGDAYRARSQESFRYASEHFFELVRNTSSRVAPYPGGDTIGTRLEAIVHGQALGAPSTGLLDLERQYNQVMPFHWAWILMLTAALAFGLNLAVPSRWGYGLGWLIFATAISYQLYGFFVRIVLAGRPPVSNLYETVVWVAFMSSMFACILELIYRKTVIILAGSLVASLGLIMADQLPLALDPKINPLLPVLRSNYWLTIHVLTIVSSYAAGTLAWGLGNLALGMLAFGNPRRDLLKTLSQFTYRAVQIAVLLLAAGTFLGGWWAAESWGRFWGWDPKEVWALIALICYVIPLHARYAGWVKDFGLAVSAVVCYAAVVMSWYGANFIIGGGLHAYASGGGGPWWIFLAGLINIEWVLLASMRYLGRMSSSMRPGSAIVNREEPVAV